MKIAKLREQIDFDDKSIARNNDRFALAQEQQKTILADKSLSPTEKLLLLANINTTLVTVEQRLGQLETDRLSAQQFLSLAENVERPAIRSPAVAVKTAGPNSRTGAAVGGLIGLIIGILAALLWEPVAARRTDGLMLEGKRVAVVVPAHDEEALLPQTLAGIPEFVDRIYVVDDASRDATARAGGGAAAGDPRVEVLAHDRNRGVGAAIVTGYRRALEERVDVTCVMAADNQMDPADLAGDRRAGRARRGRLREGEPPLHRPGVAADPEAPLPRQRRALAADEDRLRLLARRRLAVGLHRGRARRRSSASTSTGSTRATASPTTCSST